jgi:hypothetical protein
MILKLPASIALSLVIVIAIAASAAAQTKRQTPAKTPPSPVATPAPAPTPPPPTFDTLIAADTYRVYGEVRSVGQLIRSNSVNEILEPILKLAGPPKEFRTLIKWLNANADDVMSSRLLFAGWNSKPDVPETLVAIEFASPEEATKFAQKLDPFLAKMLPAPTPSPDSEKKEAQKLEPASPQYHIQQAGSLILITSSPLNLKKLRPAGSKLLAEDANFRVARNRFSTESVFVFIDMDGMQKEEEERNKRAEEEYKKTVAENANKPEAQKTEIVTDPEEEEEPPTPEATPTIVPEQQVALSATVKSPEIIGVEATAPLSDLGLGMIMSTIGSVQATWPAAIGVALSLESDSFDLRVLLVNAPGEKSDVLPFLPILATGAAITPEAPYILPADTEMAVTVSLDLPHIYNSLSIAQPNFFQPTKAEDAKENEPPFAALEKQLKIKIKDDLLPLIGSEIVVSVPMSSAGWFQPPQADITVSSSTSIEIAGSEASPSAAPSPSPSPSPAATPAEEAQNQRSVAILLSLKDKEGMRAMMPKLIESLTSKAVSSLAQTERREDTELVSYANAFAYAFIGNFLVLSPDIATTRHVVDSYLKHQTLAGDPNFRNYTRWQPRQVQGQVYISPSLMESYKKWSQQPTAPIDEQTRAFLTRFSIVPQPVTYSLSNEGFGPLHELHLPKNLVLLLVAAASGAMNAPPVQDATPVTPVPVPPARPSNPF